MRFSVSFECDGAAFEDCMASEIARILQGVADRVKSGDLPPFGVQDVNGNSVGMADIQWGELADLAPLYVGMADIQGD